MSSWNKDKVGIKYNYRRSSNRIPSIPANRTISIHYEQKSLNLSESFKLTALRNVLCVYLVTGRTIRNSNFKMHFIYGCMTSGYMRNLRWRYTYTSYLLYIVYTAHIERRRAMNYKQVYSFLHYFYYFFVSFCLHNVFQPTTLNKTCNTRTATTALYYQSQVICMCDGTYIHDDDMNIYVH